MKIQIARLFAIVSVMCAVVANPCSADEGPLKIAIAHGPGKLQLAEFAEYVEKHYDAQCRFVTAEKSKKQKDTDQHTNTPFAGLDTLDNCDVILSNLYRTWAPPSQLSVLKRTFTTLPVVGLRKAHHGFQNWRDADQEVFGVDYRGHYGTKRASVSIVPKHKDNDLLKGLHPVLPSGGCYAHRDLAKDVEVYLTGGPVGQEPHPQTWSRINAATGQRVFYTRYDPQDLKNQGVREMVIRALFWAAQRKAEKK